MIVKGRGLPGDPSFGQSTVLPTALLTVVLPAVLYASCHALMTGGG